MERTLLRLKAIADRNRLRILSCLMHHEELCACQITELLQVSGATASRHLFILQNAGLIKSRKDGRWIHYRLSLDQEFLPLQNWIQGQISQTSDIKKDQQTLEKITSISPEDLCRKQRGEDCCPL